MQRKPWSAVDTELVRRHYHDSRTADLARARAQHRSRERAAERISNAGMRETYDGAELRPFDQRAGAMQAFALPSVINGRVVARGGRS